LGINVLRDRGRGLEISAEGLNGRNLEAIFLQEFLSDALNPKVTVFFLAFLPQFVNVQAGRRRRTALGTDRQHARDARELLDCFILSTC
jgi:threonine/homoserine/homoserine lactone efflux protein